MSHELEWLTVERRDAPLLLSIPHAGTQIPEAIERSLVSPWLARKDADWYVDELYGFAAQLGATIVRTSRSRTVIDVNRNPDGASLYPGMATTGLCPIETFDGEPLYRSGSKPGDGEVAERRTSWYEPYHAALEREIARLRTRHERIVVYDAHSIRSHVPTLFAGELPIYNVGTYDARSCAPELARAVMNVCADAGQPSVLDGRFKGGYITRHYGAPANGVHAVQMELACRAYLDEPRTLSESTWPPRYDSRRASQTIASLRTVLETCIEFAAAGAAARRQA
jgi:formiminoglutamase